MTTTALNALRDAITAPPTAPVATLADKVAVVELYDPSEATGWAIGVNQALGRVWRVNPAHVTLIVPSRDDLELARFVVAEKVRARQHLRELVVDEVDRVIAAGLPLRRRTFLHPPTNTGLHRCPGCGCNVTHAHVTNSRECDAARVERRTSRSSG